MEDKTRIEMDFVDEQEEKTEAMSTVKAEEKPGFFKTVWSGITFVPRWVHKKVSESPASACIGIIGGAALGWGAKTVIGNFTKGHDTDFSPADPIEIPDNGEAYSSSTYENTADE
jgi:hypothetical protein